MRIFTKSDINVLLLEVTKKLYLELPTIDNRSVLEVRV
jgi:hypothetical protein